MPAPSRKDNEDKDKFMSRCMSDETMKKEYNNLDQRTAICVSKATESCKKIEAADFEYNIKNFGYEEEINEDKVIEGEIIEENFVDIFLPDYVDKLAVDFIIELDPIGKFNPLYVIEETINSIQDFIYNKVMKGDDYDELEEALDKEFLMIQTNKLYKEVIKYQDPYLYKVYEDFVQLINYYF